MSALFTLVRRLLGLFLTGYGAVAGVQGYQSTEMPHTIEWYGKLALLIIGGLVLTFFPEMKGTWQDLLDRLNLSPATPPLNPPTPPHTPVVTPLGPRVITPGTTPERANQIMRETALTVELAESYAKDAAILPKIVELNNMLFRKHFEAPHVPPAPATVP